MSTRKRCLLATRSPLKRSARPILEDLEIRLTLSTLPGGPRPIIGPLPEVGNTSASPEAEPMVLVYHAPGTYPAGDTPGPYGILPYDNGASTPVGVGYSPQQIRAAYGVNNIVFGDVQAEGKGMTIAIVDAFDNPDLVDTGSANFATSDLGVYDSTYGLPDPPSFTKVGQTGGAPPTAVDPTGGWEVEEALDVEMVHTIAPLANIILVEANDASNNLYIADQYASTVAPVVSNSWGSGEVSGEQSNDSTFLVPNVTFLFCSGDNGADNPMTGFGYPAYSPDVVAVGGTSLYVNPVNNKVTESAWSTDHLLGGTDGGGGSGGGTSLYEPEPSYQEGVQDTGSRTMPDVSSNANPATGVAVYDAYSGGWIQVGGTSEATPVWAGYIALADEGRALMGAAPLTGYNQTLPALYSLPDTDYNDITVGTNQTHAEIDQIGQLLGLGTYSPGYQAQPGYDEVTGLGSPRANLLVPDLAGYGLANKLFATTQPPTSVIAGDDFGLTVTVGDQLGNVDSSFDGTVTLSLASGPGGATFTPVTVPAVNGVAIFDGLNLSTTGSYQFQASAPGLGSIVTSTVGVVANPTPTAGSYYPATSDASLRAAINAADSSNFASNTIYLEAGTYTLTNSSLGQLVLQDLSNGVASKTITIVGQGPGQTIIEPSTDQGFGSRVFEVIGSSGASVTVVFQGLTITGGYAGNNGGLGGDVAVGGGLLIKDGDVTLSNVNLVGNLAEGDVGATGGKGGPGALGPDGGAGGDARGGGFYLAGGTLTLKNTVISQNIAWGGCGGTGGAAGAGLITGGQGGQGGSASGGGAYVSSGTVSGTGNNLDSNAAFGGEGGSGGTGGIGRGTSRGGPGGNGGVGGGVSGGGLFVAGGSLSLRKTDFDASWLRGGSGGWGAVAGMTKPFTSHEKTIFVGITDGFAGSGGNAQGFGVFLQGGALAMTSGGAASEFGSAGSGGINGSYILQSVLFPTFGASGTTEAGGIYVAAGTLTIAGLDVSHDKATDAGGIYNALGGQIIGTGIDVTHDTATSGIGGGIENLGSMSVGGMIASNKASIGGGVYNHGELTLTDATVMNNQATADAGGGIDNVSGTVKASHCTISNNTADTMGGGIYSQQGTLTITGVSEVDNNLVTATGTGSSFSSGSGGGIDLVGGSATITDITLSGNEARIGGGIYISARDVSISSTANTISDNIARINGGGIDNAGTLTLDNATISGNSAGADGGGIDNTGKISITNATTETISGNSAGADGGGIDNLGSLSIDNIQISGNTAVLGGGGIDNAGTLTLVDGKLDHNVALGSRVGRTVVFGRGGGILNVSTLALVDVILTQNTASAGGGLYTTGGKVNATDFTVSSNSARTGDGGGIYFHNGTLTFKQGQLVDNQAAGTNVNPSYGRGGGLYQAGGKITIAGSTSSASNTSRVGSVVGNSAAQGGGIYLAGGSLTLNLAHLANNTATESGGAILNGGSVVLANSYVFSNTAGIDGGGIDNSSSLSVLAISDSTLTNNSAGSDGGSIRNLGSATATITSSTIEDSSANLGGGFANTGTLTITASTIADNAATQLGGGIYDDITGVVNLTNSTIAENTSLAGGGGVFSQGTLQAVNDTIAENLIEAGAGGGLDVANGSAALYNTIVDSNTSGVGTDLAGTLAATSSNNLIGVPSPNLAPLSNNGGPTETIALLQDSPAIDAGANSFAASGGVTVPTTDQRGALRGGQANSLNAGTTVDIGAYEASSSFLITSAADSNTVAGTLRGGLGWAADNTNDNPENRAPSPTANAPNTLVFSTSGTFASPQTITLTLGTLTMPTTHAVAIDGPGGGLVTISGGGAFQVINVPAHATATLGGITITGGVATIGGGIANSGTLSLINTNLEGNSASQVGGGLLSTGAVSINGGTISGNSASNGGGVFSVGGLTLENATIQNNLASDDGGGVAFSSGSGGSLTITGTTFADNMAGAGAGLYIGSGTVTITGGTLTGNSATGSGGGAVFENGGSLTITSTAFTGDMAGSGTGGAIDVSDGSLTAADLTLQTNSALSGGAIAIAGVGQTIISTSNITSNSSTGGGGGILNNGSLQLSGSTLAQNLAGGSGGGVENTGTLSVEDSTFADNSALAGGGLDTSGGTEGLSNITLAGNTASSGGGGINETSGALTAVNATIAYNVNTGGGTGGGIQTSGGSAVFYNSIIDSNTASGGTDVAGTLSGDSSNNLIGSGADSLQGTKGNQVDITSPDLGTLTNNGGPTLTVALLTNSPAIDMGANTISGVTVPTTDQRGALRGAFGINAGSAVDIGAYEASSSYAVNTSADTTDTGTLRTGVGWADVSFNDNPANLGTSLTANQANTVQIDTTEPIALSSMLGALVLSNTATAEAIDNVGAGPAVISGSGAVGVLQVRADVTATLTNLEVTAGLAAAGGGINNAGSLTLNTSTVSGNSATGSGGGINNTGSLTLNDGATVSGNSAMAGGGINNTGTLVLGDSATISGNSASGSGGGINNTGTLTMDSSTIEQNTAGSGGGVDVGGTMTVTNNSTIMGNLATLSGGGVGVTVTGTFTISNSTISDNSAVDDGGGIDSAGILTLGHSATISGNSASGSGGGVDVEAGGTATAVYSTVSGNAAATGGGGIDNNGLLSITITTIQSNTVGGSGGGVGDEVGGTLTLTDSTLSGNQAGTSGGGLSNAGTASLTNATIAGNTGSSAGGVLNTGTLTAVNATIAENSISSSGTGGGLYAQLGTATLNNTIVAANTSGASTASNVAGSLVLTSANNLFGQGGAGGLTTFDNNLINVSNPGLGTLANNGGPTETIALMAGSPAIDAGSNDLAVDPNTGQSLTTDQRGAQRGPAGLDAGTSVDIGAYEATSSYLVTTTTDSTDMGTLRAGLDGWANASTNAHAPAGTPNTMVFDTSGTFASPQTITLSPSLGPLVMSNPTTPESISGTDSNGLTISGGGAVGVITVDSDTTATLRGLTITGGSSTSGGGIINQGELLTILNSTITGNSATNGGAIDNSGVLDLENSTLNNNTATANGGAIDNESTGVLTTSNGTIAANAAADGGGIFNAGTLTLVSTTVAYNSSGGSGTGGGLDASSGTSLLYNTIVAQNTDSSSSADDVAGTLSHDSTDNLFGTSGSGGLSTANDNLINVANPGLGALSNNGGVTQTIPLLGASPAIGAGSSSIPGVTVPITDQRGAVRGVGDVAPDTAIDIGSYELSSSYLVTSPTDSLVPGTLRAAVAWADVNSGTDPIHILFDTNGLFSQPQTITLTLGTLDLTNTTAPINIDWTGSNPLTISGNGAFGIFAIAPGVTANFTALTLIDGSAATSGGAISNAGDLTVTASALMDNAALSGSGAGIINTGALTVVNSSFSDNDAAYYGGAIYNNGGTTSVSSSTFEGNATLYGLGGALDNQGGTLTVTGSTFLDNTSFKGGAIFNGAGMTSVTTSTIMGNSAYQGGGLFNDGNATTTGTFTVTDSTIAGNSAFQGGGISNTYGGTMTVDDSTLANNTATQYGGAIDEVGNLTLISDTIAYNVVVPGGIAGGIDAYAGTTALYDTIVVLNTVGTGTSVPASDIVGSVSAASAYNLVGSGGLTNGVNNNLVGVTKPGLAASLANNGGPTETIALVVGSPALGAGSAAVTDITVPATDQRGDSRPTTAIDIGAYQTSTLIVTPGSTGSLSTGATPAVASVAAASATTSGPAVAATMTPPIVRSANPFKGRKLSSNGRRHSVAAASHAKVHHADAATHASAHHAVRAVSVPRKTPTVRVAKHHR